MPSEAKKVTDELDKFVGRLIAQLSSEIAAELTEATPVDTGWAQANWVPGVGGPGASSTANRGNASQAAAAQQAGLASVITYQLGQGNVYITNNVPYITILNEGSSSQAPSGFVQKAIADGLNSLARSGG